MRSNAGTPNGMNRNGNKIEDFHLEIEYLKIRNDLVGFRSSQQPSLAMLMCVVFVEVVFFLF